MFIYTLTEFDSRPTRDVDLLKNTLIHRNREIFSNIFVDITNFKTNKFLLTQWRAFVPAKETGLLFNDAIDRIKLFLEPIYQSILQGTEFNKWWKCGEKQWI